MFQPKHNLARLRHSLSLTQQQLANLVGCSLATVKAVETGKLVLSTKLADRLSKALNVSATWLLENDLTAPIPNRSSEIDLEVMEWI